MNNLIKYLFNISVIIVLIITSGCNKKNENYTTLNYWGMGVEGEKLDSLVSEFEALNPGIRVKIQRIPWTAAHEKLITAFASETMPDVFQLGNTWIPEFEAINALEPLNNRISKSSIIKKENYFSGVWETNIIDSTVYGIPWYVDTRVLFYRKDVLKRAGYDNPPKTWPELLDVSKKIKALQSGQKKYAFFLPVNEWAPFIIFGLQNKSCLLKNNNQYGDFSGKDFKEAYNYLMQYYDLNLAPDGMTEVSNIYQAFAEEYFSMFISGPWNVVELKNRFPKELQNNWMVAPLPSPDNNYPGVSLAGGASLVIANSSKNKDAAWKFVEFLSKKESQLKFYKTVADLPAVKEAWLDPLLANDKYMQAFYAQLQRAVPTPKIPEWEQIVISKIQTTTEKTAKKSVSVDEALKTLDNDVNTILEKHRWIMQQKNNSEKKHE